MIKKVMLSLIILGTIALSCIYGTYAWFTSVAVSNDNIFETGELAIGLPLTGINDGILSAESLFPGESVTGSVKVQNIGDVVFKYKVRAQKDNGDDALFNKLNLLIKNGETIIYNGAVKDCSKKIGNIAPSNFDTLNFTVTLPEDTDNTYQGKQSNIKFIFDATQVANTEWE